MYKRHYRRKTRDYGDIAQGIVGFLVLGVTYLGSIYYVNKGEFWTIIKHYILPALAALLFLVVGYVYFVRQRNKQKQNHILAILQNIQEIGFENAVNSFIDRFGKEGKVNGSHWEYRGYSFDWKRLEDFRETMVQNKIPISTKDYQELASVLRDFIDKKEKHFLNDGIQATSSNSISELSKRGDDFEHLVVRLYEAMGYSAKRIGGHGDQGGDVLASKDGANTLIQAKCYQNMTVGNSAVQQVVGALQYYGCTEAVVVTTSTFTPEAVALAKANSVELIDKKILQQKLLEHLHEVWK